MSEKEFSKNGNIPHVPKEQADEAELLPLENNAREAKGHEAELNPVQAELTLPENDYAEAEGHEAELNPVEAESSPPKIDCTGIAEKQKPRYHPAEAILWRSENDCAEAKGYEAELNPVKAETLPPKNDYARKAEKQKPLYHPAEAILWRPRNDDVEAEGNEVERDPLETESKDSDHNSSLEGAVGGVIDDCDCGDIHYSPCKKSRIHPAKEVVFRKFFSDEYDQMKAPILGRQRHSAQIQRPRHRHVSEDSRLSDENPLGCLQDAGTSGGAVLNQAGAIIGRYIPKEEIPEYARFGTEFGQSLPLIPKTEGSEHSFGSTATARISDVYGGGDFSVPPSSVSYDSIEFGHRISFGSYSSRPTTASDNQETSLPPDSNSSEDCKEQVPTASSSENIAHEKPVRRRRSGIVANPEIISKASLARTLADADKWQDEELKQRELSKDMSVPSEPSPQRKISKDSSGNSEKMSSEDCVNYPDSLESDSYVPKPDIDTAVDSLEENFGSLGISDTESPRVVQNVSLEQETQACDESSEQDLVTTSSSSEVGGSQPLM